MRTTRLLARRITVAAIIAMLLATGLTSTPAHAAPPRLPDSCSPESARILGWMWADASYNNDTGRFFYRTMNARVTRTLSAMLDDFGLTYDTGTSSAGHNNFRILIPGYDDSFFLKDPMKDRRARCSVRSFLASVIESEGSAGGTIIDDPRWVRRRIVADALTSVDIEPIWLREQIRTRSTDWPKFRTFPFLACGRVPGGIENCRVARSNPPVTRTPLIPRGAWWRYTASPQTNNKWRWRYFNASSWSSGHAELGFGDSSETTRLPRGSMTYYFRRAFDAPGPTDTLRLTVRRDDGAVIYLNGREVKRTNMPAGPIKPFTRASSGIQGDAEDLWHTFTISGENLRNGRNIVAVEVHQFRRTSGDLAFDLELSPLS